MTKARDLANASTALSAVSATELGYLDGVTSAVQTQIDGKQAVVSGVNSTEIGYLDGVTSAIQTQLDAKIPKTLTTTTGDIIYASGANTPARLGIGSTGNVLTVSGGVPVWSAPAGGGKVLQVVQATYSTSTTIASTTYTDTGLSASITPSSTSSKILVLVNQAAYAQRGASNTAAIGLQILRNSTAVLTLLSPQALFLAIGGASEVYGGGITAMTYLDSPATTSSVTYKTQGKTETTAQSGAFIAQNSGLTSVITLMEIGA